MVHRPAYWGAEQEKQDGEWCWRGKWKVSCTASLERGTET